MKENIYTRSCPSCDKIIEYKIKKLYMQAIRRNYKCEKYCHGPHEDDERWCSGCKQYINKSNFGNNVSRTSGIHDKCKKCANNESKKYHNLERSRLYDRKNKDKRNAQRRARLNYKENCRKYARKRRDLKVETKETYSVKDEKITFKEFNNKCFNCGSYANLCIDHHRPLSLGFPLSLNNAVVLCNTCNASKGPKRPEEFYGLELCLKLDKVLNEIGKKYKK